MTLDGYSARIDYDPEADLFRGEILGLNGGADFYGKNPNELRREFKRSLAVFLEVCAEKGIEPRRNYSGRFNLRIAPELHERLAIAAQAEGKSINTLELREADVVVRPLLAGVGSADFNARKRSIAAGRAAMQLRLPELKLALEARGR